MTEKHILITGGAGYIGSLLTSELLRLDYRVTVLDSLLFGGEAILPFLHHPNFHFHKTDVPVPRAVKDALKDGWQKPNAVIHLAAIVGFPACQAVGKPVAWKYNVESTKAVFGQAADLGVERFVFASDAATGRPLWDFQTGQTGGRTVSNPTSFLVDGRQVVAFTAGRNLIAFARCRTSVPGAPALCSGRGRWQTAPVDIVAIDVGETLFVSGEIEDWEALAERGIDTIVDMDASVDAGLPQAPGSILYVYHPILDEDLPNLVKIEALGRLVADLVSSDHRVLVHCRMGFNRSVLVVATALTYLEMTLKGQKAIANRNPSG